MQIFDTYYIEGMIIKKKHFIDHGLNLYFVEKCFNYFYIMRKNFPKKLGHNRGELGYLDVNA